MNSLNYPCTLADPQFLARYKARWAELRPGILEDCFARLDDYALQCGSAMETNAARWPIGKNYEEEIGKMKSWLTVRAANYSAVVANY